MTTTRQALISVSDKTGATELASALHRLGISILSTGGTAGLLAEAGIPVTEVASYTGFPEMLDGRVKTLHPRIHGGILARRDLPGHVDAMSREGIGYIDFVIVNLYPFRETVARPGCSLEEAVENIDIGGPAMVRAAAKNYPHVTVVTDPADYPAIIAELERTGGAISLETRFALASKAFSHTASYDAAISNHLGAIARDGTRLAFPARLNLAFVKAQDLRYGENPHQHGAFYRDEQAVPGGISRYRQIQGKELSFNNIADADAAWECVKAITGPACVIVKHANPCGVAQAESLEQAYRRAFETDPTSAFGGIIAFNAVIDAATAQAILGNQFVEVVVAPGYATEAAEIFAARANVRLLEVPLARDAQALDIKRVGGGILVQTTDSRDISPEELRVVTRVAPTPAQMADLTFAWRVAKFVKSNAIVFCRDGRTLGVGAGQMSRIDSARIASIKAGNASLSLAGSVVASDAFFPFRDGLDAVAEAGAAAIIQPGGSVRDDEVIAAADERGLAMVFTGVRHFRH